MFFLITETRSNRRCSLRWRPARHCDDDGPVGEGELQVLGQDDSQQTGLVDSWGSQKARRLFLGPIDWAYFSDRNWCFTVHNYDQTDIDLFNKAYNDGECEYFVIGKEVGEMNGTRNHGGSDNAGNAGLRG